LKSCFPFSKKENKKTKQKIKRKKKQKNKNIKKIKKHVGKYAIMVGVYGSLKNKELMRSLS
jgi:hypothetical protein